MNHTCTICQDSGTVSARCAGGCCPSGSMSLCGCFQYCGCATGLALRVRAEEERQARATRRPAREWDSWQGIRV